MLILLLYLKKKGIFKDKLSKLAGINLHKITKIEFAPTPDPKIETVQKIANFLAVCIGGLMKK